MPDDKAATLPAVELDEDGKKLQLEAEKAKYVEAIAKARQATAEADAASLKTLVPSVTDAPKGEVTLGEAAGAFGPWRAHQVIDGMAGRIAETVPGLLTGAANPRLLVVDDDRSLLPDDWTARQVRSTLGRLSSRLQPLATDLRDGLQQLEAAIDRYQREEETPAPSPAEPPVSRRRGAGPGVTPEAASEAPAAPSAAPADGARGMLGAAVDLLGLLRTDYTFTATAVSATPGELATLVAGHLAAQQVPATAGAAQRPLAVEADAFSTVRASPSTEKLAAVLKARDAAVQAIAGVQELLAPVEAELASIKARVALVEQTWATAVAEKKDESATEPLRLAVDRLVRQASRREQAGGPARTLVAYAQQVVTDVDAAVAALLTAPEGGEAPLLTAVRRERLDATVDSEKITHVLSVNLDGVAADALTRRSILGTSGRIRFLSGGNASWLLLEASSGTVAGGGQVSLADVMTFGLENGNAQFTTDGQWLQPSTVGDEDPLRTLEAWAKGIVVVLVLILFLLGALSVLSFLAVISAAR